MRDDSLNNDARSKIVNLIKDEISKKEVEKSVFTIRFCRANGKLEIEIPSTAIEKISVLNSEMGD